MIEMVHALAWGLLQVFSATTIGLMSLGVMIGFVVGILPGLGGATTLALMLPFIIKMKAVDAFAFLLGMAAVVNTTGDITSIIFGVPGEPTTAATVVDGHSMAKKGEAGRALGAALVSSLVGAVFGAFALALAIPVVRPLVFAFGSPEFFMLAILGLTFVASLSGEAVLKGLVAAGIGLLFATIGLDPVAGTERYTFGQLFLWDGIGLVPITIGFFAIPEIIDLAVQGSSIGREQINKVGGVLEGVKDTFRHGWLVLRCSAIGTLAGIIPGMGPAVSQWLAYAHAVQSAPDKERFGKGAVEGVLGPGAANNSSMGGVMITTVAFGVPTSVMMAVLMGAFLIQGIVPGPDMLIPEPKGHLGLTFSFVWTIVVSNIMAAGICFVFLKQLVKVTEVRSSLITPFILLLIFLGAFAEKHAFEDLILVLFFGALGWVMERLDWPRPPLILGLVLGPLTENRFFLSVRNYGVDWLLRPGVVLLIALTLGGALYPMLKAVWQKRKGRETPSIQLVPSQKEEEGPPSSWAIIFDLLVVLMFMGALWESREFTFRAGLFPWALGATFLILSGTHFALDLCGRKGKRPTASSAQPKQERLSPIANRTAAIAGWILAYFVAIWLLGFSVGVPLCIFLQIKIAGREKWLLTLILTASAWALIYGLFGRFLHVPFPAGELFRWI